MDFDFPNTQLPRLVPLEHSFSVDEVEDDLKAIFLAQFSQLLSERVFDVNALGAPHLGSFGLVRRAVNADGLVLLQGDREMAATRHLYRAWKSGDGQGRGLHFLRTYLQLLYPNQCEVEQLWQEKVAPYPTSLRSTLSEGERDAYFLTSRIRVLLYYGAVALQVSRLADILQAVMPARLVPEFGFLLRAPDAELFVGAALVCGEVVELFPQSVELLESQADVFAGAALTMNETVEVMG